MGRADQATAGGVFNRVALIGSQIGEGYVAIQSHDVFLYAGMIFSIALVPVALTRTLWLQAPAAVCGMA